MKKTTKKTLMLLLSLVMLLSFASLSAYASSNAEVEAVVTKVPGSTNILTVIVTDDNGVYSNEFIINNNSDGYFYVSGYQVYVSTYGNDKIRECYIASVQSSQGNTSQLDLESFDFTMPYTETHHFVDDKGTTSTLDLSFVPDLPRGSSSNPASTGTWTSSYNAGIVSMSYRFDVGRSGTQWTISNGRDHTYYAVFTSFSNPSLSISRSTSTASFPAEINARVEYAVFDNQWVGPIASGSCWMRTEITSGGTMTLYW
jgi:hypothetical protein